MTNSEARKRLREAQNAAQEPRTATNEAEVGVGATEGLTDAEPRCGDVREVEGRIAVYVPTRWEWLDGTWTAIPLSMGPTLGNVYDLAAHTAALSQRLAEVEAERDRFRDAVRGHEAMRWPEEAHRLQQQRNAALARAEAVERQSAAQAEVIERLAGAAVVRHKGPNDTDAAMLMRAGENLLNGYEIGGSNVKTAVAAVLFQVSHILADAPTPPTEAVAATIREALGSTESPDVLRAMLLDAADRLGDPWHKGNAHAWPKHAEMFRRLAERVDTPPTEAEDRAFDPSQMNHGTCPKCHEWKFIGHGPLCIDCFTNPPTTDAKEAHNA